MDAVVKRQHTPDGTPADVSRTIGAQCTPRLPMVWKKQAHVLDVSVHRLRDAGAQAVFLKLWRRVLRHIRACIRAHRPAGAARLESYKLRALNQFYNVLYNWSGSTVTVVASQPWWASMGHIDNACARPVVSLNLHGRSNYADFGVYAATT